MTNTVWIVNPYDNLPSEGNRPQRYWLMSEAFVRAGYRVVYWTSDFSHATKQKRVENKPCGDGDREIGIEVLQIPTLPYKKNICLARVRSHKRLARDFKRMAEEKLAGCAPDLIIASVPPLGLCKAAMQVARKCEAKFICDVQDAWPETFERILPRFVLAALGMRKTARQLYCEADGVSAVSRRYLELARTYGSNAPSHLAGHVIDVSHGELISRVEMERCRPLRLVYAGNMSMSYDLETVIMAVGELPDVTLDVAGNGPDIERLRSISQSTHPVSICFHGYLGEYALAELLRSCDVGIVPMFPESCVGVPGKLADYAAAGLRVIESLGGECQEIISRYGVGEHYVSGDVDSFKAAIRTILEQPPCDPLRLKDFASSFDAKVIMGEYVNWCKEIVK